MTGANSGIGLANVRRRLALCYGEETRLEVNVADHITCIGFVLPLKHSREASTTV
jgi:LytS/YehU family sensor histidine kinase